MNHNKIKTIPGGTVFKNKRAFCDAVGVDYDTQAKSGKAWQLLTDRFNECHGKIKWDGRKIVVEEVYDEEKPHIDKRGKGNRSIYQEDLKNTLMCFLRDRHNVVDGRVSYTDTLSNWYVYAGLVNRSYKAGHKDTKDDYSYNKYGENIRYIYDKVDDKSYQIFMDNVKALKNKGVIADFEEIYFIEGIRHTIPKSISTSAYFEKYGCRNDAPVETWHEASDSDKHLIAHIKHLLCKEFQLKNYYKYMYLPGKKRNPEKNYERFSAKRKEYMGQIGWQEWSRQFRISWNQEDLIDELKYQEEARKLNNSVCGYYTRKIEGDYQTTVKKRLAKSVFGSREEYEKKVLSEEQNNREQRLSLIEERVRIE